MDEQTKFKYRIAAFSVLAAVMIAGGVILVTNPHDITANVLILTAQLLVFAASIYGIDGIFKDFKKISEK